MTLDAARRIVEASKRAEERARFDLASHPKRYVSVPDLAAFLAVDRRTIIRMIGAGSLAAVKVGRAWRVDAESARAVFHVERSKQQHAS